jgi:hypothetical protein
MSETKDSKDITEVILKDGRKVTKRNPRVRELARAEEQPKNKEHLIKYATMAAKINIDGKPAVLDDLLDLFEDELVQIGEKLFGEEIEKNA